MHDWICLHQKGEPLQTVGFFFSFILFAAAAAVAASDAAVKENRTSICVCVSACVQNYYSAHFETYCQELSCSVCGRLSEWVFIHLF